MIVVFDAVGTLITTIHSVAHEYHQAGQKFGSDLTVEQVRNRFRMGRKQIFETVFQDSFSNREFLSSEEIEFELWRKLVQFVFDDVGQPDKLFEFLWHHFQSPENWRIFDDVKDALGDLKNLGIEFLIGSNFDARILPIFAHWLPEVGRDSIFWSSHVGFRKPDLRFYQSIEAARPNESCFVMIGDDPVNDYEAPIKHGWRAVLVDRQPRSASSVMRIQSLKELSASIEPMMET